MATARRIARGLDIRRMVNPPSDVTRKYRPRRMNSDSLQNAASARTRDNRIRSTRPLAPPRAQY